MSILDKDFAQKVEEKFIVGNYLSKKVPLWSAWESTAEMRWNRQQANTIARYLGYNTIQGLWSVFLKQSVDARWVGMRNRQMDSKRGIRVVEDYSPQKCIGICQAFANCIDTVECDLTQVPYNQPQWDMIVSGSSLDTGERPIVVKILKDTPTFKRVVRISTDSGASTLWIAIMECTLDGNNWEPEWRWKQAQSCHIEFPVDKEVSIFVR